MMMIIMIITNYMPTENATQCKNKHNTVTVRTADTALTRNALYLDSVIVDLVDNCSYAIPWLGEDCY